MGREVARVSEVAAQTFSEASSALDLDVSQLCFDGPAETLGLTEFTQPAILSTSIALFRALGEKPDCAAGHSLGEYSAHVAAGTLAFADAVRLVRERGRLMQEAVPEGQGAMAAVMGLSSARVVEACAAATGHVEPANFNSPAQTVVAGERAAVESLSAALKGQARVVPLSVSAPFHSRLMQPAAEALRPRLEAATFKTPRFPVYSNVDALPVTDGNQAREMLYQQVASAVRWESCILRMLEDGVTLFVEVGPGKVLTGLVGRIVPQVARLNVETPEHFAEARSLIQATRGLK